MKHLKRSRLACAIGAILSLLVVQSPRLFAQSTTDGAIGGLVADTDRREPARRHRDRAQRRHEQFRRRRQPTPRGAFQVIRLAAR